MTSTFAETGERGKNSRLLPYESSDRVKEDDGESFGKSRVSYAFDRKMLMRRIARERRAKYLMRVPIPTILHPHRIEVVEPQFGDAQQLGIRSYRKLVPNRLSLTSDPVNREGAWLAVSLPYVSILG